MNLDAHKLERNPCEDQHYQWGSSESCYALTDTKLLLKEFLGDVSWLLVASVLKQVAFNVRSVEKKIVYQVLGGDSESSSSYSNNNLSSVNFSIDNGMLVPFVARFVQEDNTEIHHAHASLEVEQSLGSELMNLRRSKCRNIQPDRYLVICIVSGLEVGFVRTRPYKIESWKEVIGHCHHLVCLASEQTAQKITLSVNKRTSGSFENNKISGSCEHTKISGSHEHTRSSGIRELYFTYHCRNNTRKAQRKGADLITFENYHLHPKVPDPDNYLEEISEISSRQYYNYGTPKMQKMNSLVLEDMGSLSAGAYKELIDSLLRNIDTSSTKEEPPITDQWEQFKAKNTEQKRKMEVHKNEEEDDEESSELEMLWREMELSLASSYLMEDTEGSNDATFAETVKKSSGLCQHEYGMDEEFGIFCFKCSIVSTEIKDIAPPFEKKCNEEDSEKKADKDEGLDLFTSHASSDTHLSEENDNVWALIPELRRKLHFHQKRAFEFLWKNIAGSMVPSLMEAESKKRGGCVVSHTPRAGKTFLIIAFLVSHLKLFPGKRPLVLAPKTTLYTCMCTAASRVILLDSEWNPSKTKQAIARAFRPGQQRMVYVYQLLATGTLEEDKYHRTTWKEWLSSMIFSEAFVEDPSRWQAEKIEDDILREMVAEDRSKSFHMIMKNEKASTS
ncbi:SNF2 domain-containing protein CLASSY [Quillaja saponaria]|uniref:SNF2 domain-containing protein CLASSY n=1 Tax=Quillaja saponaria TaxID=32244 RepID=A0AAD7PL42_QUISA|nr:SNF2 domain-containing protein CLASSY [Quillaja saponaria]